MTCAIHASFFDEVSEEKIDERAATTFSTSVSEIEAGGYATLETVFDRIIPLGQRCPNKMELNLLFNPQERDYNKTKRGHADLFDWSAILNYDLFVLALSNNLTDFFEKEDFIQEITQGKKIIVNTKYEMRWSHLFDKFDIHWTEFSLDTFKENFDSIKEKIDYLRKKFIEAKTVSALYTIVHEAEGLDEPMLRKLRDSLLLVREGNKNFMILAISKIAMSESFENIIVRCASKFKLRRKGGDNTPRWNEIFRQFNFSEDIWS